MAIQSAEEHLAHVYAMIADRRHAEALAHQTDRDDAIRAEERAALAVVARGIVAIDPSKQFARNVLMMFAERMEGGARAQPEPATDCVHAGYGATYRDGGPYAYCNNCGVRLPGETGCADATDPVKSPPP